MALFAEFTNGEELTVHIGTFVQTMNNQFDEIHKIYADGDELNRCFSILNRNNSLKRHHVFIGEAAKEIAINWY